MRDGCRLVKLAAPALALGPLPYQPTTSAMTWDVPAELKMSTLPPVPTLATVRLPTVCPRLKVRVARPWGGVPAGTTLR